MLANNWVSGRPKLVSISWRMAANGTGGRLSCNSSRVGLRRFADQVGPGGQGLAELDGRRADRGEGAGVIGVAGLDRAEPRQRAAAGAPVRGHIGIGLDPAQCAPWRARMRPQRSRRNRCVVAVVTPAGYTFQPECMATSPPSSGSTRVWANPASRIMSSNSVMGGKRRIDSTR